jgi:hypothetical protein
MAQDSRNQQKPAGRPIVDRQFERAVGELPHVFRMETCFRAKKEGTERDGDCRLREERHEIDGAIAA